MVQGEPGSLLWQQTEFGGRFLKYRCLTPATPFRPKSSWLCSLRSFARWQVGKGGVSLFRYYSSPLPFSNKWLVFVQNRTCTRRLVKDVRLLERKKKFFLDTLHSSLGTPACKIGACCRNQWKLAWAFETRHRGCRSHKGSEYEGSSSLRNVEYLGGEKKKKENLF